MQFSNISTEQKDLLSDQKGLPANILAFIDQFDSSLSTDEFSSPKYAYRILFVPKTVNRKGQADRVIEFVKSDSPLAQGLNKEYAVIKEIEKPKFLPSQIVKKMKDEGYKDFSMHNHTQLKNKHDAANPVNGYGVLVAGKNWHYYENWLDVIRKHCKDNKD